MRRIIDILVGALFLIITAPSMLLIAILIKLDSPGPVFYLPRMVGHFGKVFSLFRFRTMSPAPPSPDSGQTLTRVGRLIRYYSLDHLPMLIHLLTGDLTLVGPRPMEVDTVNMQDPVWQEYFQRKPGLFNYAVLKLGRLWTPSRRSHPALNQELELQYRQRPSIVRDVQLVSQFLWALIASGGNVKARGKPDPEVENKLSQRRFR